MIVPSIEDLLMMILGVLVFILIGVFEISISLYKLQNDKRQ